MCKDSATNLSILVTKSSGRSLNEILDNTNSSEHKRRAKRKAVRRDEKIEQHCTKKYLLSQIIRSYFDLYICTSLRSLLSFLNMLIYHISGQVDVISYYMWYFSEIMLSAYFGTLLEWLEIQSRQYLSTSRKLSFKHDGSIQSSMESLTSSSTLDEDDLSPYNSPRRGNEELRTSSSFIPLSFEEDADDWGHFMDFQESETLSSSDTTSDPFQSLTKSILRRRGAKISVCKLGQLKEEDSFIMREAE